MNSSVRLQKLNDDFQLDKVESKQGTESLWR